MCCKHNPERDAAIPFGIDPSSAIDAMLNKVDQIAL